MDAFLELCDDSPVYHASNGQRFTITHWTPLTHFLADSLSDSDTNHQLLVDWTRCKTHPLIFDIDVQTKSNLSTFDHLMQYFDLLFLDVFKKFVNIPQASFLLAMRRQARSGLHVHVLNVELSHDDYIHLCRLMEKACLSQDKDITIRLDCMSSMPLVACDKPKGTGGLYIPVRLVQVQFRKYFCEIDSLWKSQKIKSLYFSKGDTVFDQLSPHMSQNHWRKVAGSLMPLSPAGGNVFSFSTYIVPEPLWRHTSAHFTSCLNEQSYAFEKDNRLTGNPSMQCYSFLKQNARFIEPFVELRNPVLKTWYKRFSRGFENGTWIAIDQKLFKQCVHLKDETSPLETVLRNEEWLLPVYYALRNWMKKKNKVIEHPLFPFSASPPNETEHLTLDTILYCAFKTAPSATKEGAWFTFMGMGWDWILQAMVCVQGWKKNLQSLQKRFYPVVKGCVLEEEESYQGPALEKKEPLQWSGEEKVYQWNPVMDKWREVKNDDQLEDMVKDLYALVKYFEGYSNMSEILRNLLEETLDVWVNEIVQEIRNDLKQSKLFVRHFKKITFESKMNEYGGNVPEYYLFPYGAPDYCCSTCHLSITDCGK